MALLNDSVDFTVKWRKEYGQNKKKHFSVEELGRHFRENPLDIETWSKESGLPIPEECKVPFVYPPKSLPLSLKMQRWFEDKYASFIDVTNPHFNSFKVNSPPKDLQEVEFLNIFYSIEKCLTWALRENVDLSGSDFFIIGHILRKLASCAYTLRFSDFQCAVLLYKDKIFIDGIVDEESKFWRKGLKSNCKQEYLMPVDLSINRNSNPISVPYITYDEEFVRECELGKHGKKFEDVMKSGGPGNPLYNGEDVDVRCTKRISLGNHKIISVTRLSCQSPDGPVDSQENYVEVKTMFPHTRERFAKFKSCSLWIHCALFGIDTVYCGMRNPDGLLIDVKRYTMEDLADIGKEYWSPNEILTFLDTVLIWLKQKLNKSATRTRHGEEWLRSKLLAEEAPTFTLSCDGDGFIRLTAEDHPEFRRVITEKYDHIGKNNRNNEFDQSDDDNVPDTWDNSD
jgi:hypothetical protein